MECLILQLADSVTAPWDLKNTEGKFWLKNFYPGMEDWGHFRLKNNSKSDISLVLKGTITSATTWNLDLVPVKQNIVLLPILKTPLLP